MHKRLEAHLLVLVPGKGIKSLEHTRVALGHETHGSEQLQHQNVRAVLACQCLGRGLAVERVDCAQTQTDLIDCVRVRHDRVESKRIVHERAQTQHTQVVVHVVPALIVHVDEIIHQDVQAAEVLGPRHVIFLLVFLVLLRHLVVDKLLHPFERVGAQGDLEATQDGADRLDARRQLLDLGFLSPLLVDGIEVCQQALQIEAWWMPCHHLHLCPHEMPLLLVALLHQLRHLGLGDVHGIQHASKLPVKHIGLGHAGHPIVQHHLCLDGFWASNSILCHHPPCGLGRLWHCPSTPRAGKQRHTKKNSL
eukprot:m.90968 g.90968  ORF g.90968 m.90968 type:complete len:307 (-) comp13717_c0_seq3:105-1025(-)